MADGVFQCETPVIFGALFRRHVRDVCLFHGHGDVQVRLSGLSGSQGDGKLFVFPERTLPEPVAAVFRRGPHEHVAQSGSQGGLAVGVGRFACDSVEFGIVVELELHQCSFDRLPVRRCHSDCRCGGVGIVVYDIDFCIVVRRFHDFFRAVVVAEHFGVHQHAAAGRGVEPSQVEHRFRFASAQEMPFPVHPYFHPGMIVIRMCPSGCVHLAGRYAHGAECTHGEGGLFATASVGCTHGSQWCAGAHVRRCVGHLFMTPVVDF